MHLRACLIVVAYHPSAVEVAQLQTCLRALPEDIGYGVVVNDHRPGEPVEALAEASQVFLPNRHNPGYGRAINQAVAALAAIGPLPTYLGALNTDLTWQRGCFETLLGWLDRHSDVVLAVPQLCNPQGEVQQLCKQNPSLLGLFSRRFIPEFCKPLWLRRYDRHYVMADRDYTEIFEAPYLSGCCMLMRMQAFLAVGGFDERFFLYLEDADISRSLAVYGRTIHLPIASVVHHWGRGNHRSKKLTLVNLHSAWIYFRKWGLRLI
jgi:hypothetical protein